MRTTLALVVLLLAAPLLAQDQTLEPSGTVSETNGDCTTSDAHTRTSDNSDATLCDGGDGSGAENYNLLMSFDTPSANPSTVTDDQEFQCRAQKSSTAGNGDPSFTMDLFCGGVLRVAGNSKTVTSTSPVEFSDLFTFPSADCAADGSDAEIRTDISRAGGTPGGRRSVDMIDCDWDVTHAVAGGARRVILTGVRQ